MNGTARIHILQMPSLVVYHNRGGAAAALPRIPTGGVQLYLLHLSSIRAPCLPTPHPPPSEPSRGGSDTTYPGIVVMSGKMTLGGLFGRLPCLERPTYC